MLIPEPPSLAVHVTVTTPSFSQTTSLVIAATGSVLSALNVSVLDEPVFPAVSAIAIDAV